jgi:hypothetical protein
MSKGRALVSACSLTCICTVSRPKRRCSSSALWSALQCSGELLLLPKRAAAAAAAAFLILRAIICPASDMSMTPCGEVSRSCRSRCTRVCTCSTLGALSYVSPSAFSCNCALQRAGVAVSTSRKRAGEGGGCADTGRCAGTERGRACCLVLLSPESSSFARQRLRMESSSSSFCFATCSHATPHNLSAGARVA